MSKGIQQLNFFFLHCDAASLHTSIKKLLYNSHAAQFPMQKCNPVFAEQYFSKNGVLY